MTQVGETVAPPFTAAVSKGAMLASAGALMASASPGFLYLAAHAHLTPLAHDVALFGHLACLVLGFGAVLSVDWVALLWIIRRRTLTDVLKAAGNVHVPIWAGYAGLVVTGLFLEPQIDVLRTQIKLATVLAIGLNGLVAMWLHHLLQNRLRRRVLLASVVCASLSQVGWWAATGIGFINAH
jgi:hypothetical protein